MLHYQGSRVKGGGQEKFDFYTTNSLKMMMVKKQIENSVT